MNWTEILIKVPVTQADAAADIANMTVPYGIYVEDYSDLEQGAWEIAHIDLIDEELLERDREHAIIHIYIPESERVDEALAYLSERFLATDITHKIDTNGISEEQWENNWKQFFKCTKIGSRLLVRPSWEEYDNQDGRVVLSIDPGAAFGTGTHATTRMCLELLEKHVKTGNTLLDIGCGSGILAVTSVLLGAKHAVGVDIDSMAVKVAKENAELNAVEDKTEFLCGNLGDKISGKFDIVVANIVADVVIELTESVENFMNKDGLFICSGIIDIRAEEVKSALLQHGFIIKEELVSENWNAFLAVLKE